MQPIRRDLSFKLPANRINDWHARGLHVTQFFNTLSVFFPSGERFFIDSVRQFRKHEAVQSESLQKAITAFIGQEAMHGREHEDYNALLQAAGLPAQRMERLVIAILEHAKANTSAEVRLGFTVALEHFTAILADSLLSEPEVIEGSEPRYAALWRWHALEETEHKAVVYDVWDAVMGKGLRAYALRSSTMVVATAVFWALIVPFMIENVRRSGGARDLRGWASVLDFHWRRPGMLRRIVRPYFDYFRPDFHPWQHDNRALLADIERIAAEFTAQPLPQAA